MIFKNAEVVRVVFLVAAVPTPGVQQLFGNRSLGQGDGERNSGRLQNSVFMSRVWLSFLTHSQSV